MNATLTLIVKRIGLAMLTLLLVSIVIFAITSLLPGDAAEEALGQGATPETVAALRIQLGLDQPGYVRYWRWLSGMLSGNPGQSLANNLPVSELIAKRLPKSLVLAGTTAAVSVPLALLIGILSAMYRGSRLDRTMNVMTLSMVAVPEFLVATLAVLIFAKLNRLSSLSSPPCHAGRLARACRMPG
jgi:peptide/nickel transport system permease protein